MGIVKPSQDHQVVYADLSALIAKHAAEVSAEEILAIAANMVGKLIAMQDQRTMTSERAMETVIQNLTAGNEEMMSILAKTEGSA